MDKQDTPQTFWLQRGSFTTVVVDNEKANPEWGRKPFKVIEIHAIEQLQSQLTAAQAEIAKLQSALDVAAEGLKTIHIGVDPRNGEWSEEFQDTMLKCFTAKTASDYANETLDKIKQIRE